MITLKDVAEKAGVSTATVSYVLNNNDKKISEKVAQKVRAAAAELEYKPNIMARALRSNKSSIIGVLSEDITTFQVNNIVQGIVQSADKENFQVLLGDLNLNGKIWHDGIQDYSKVMDCREEIQEKIDVFLKAGAGGIIYVGMHDRDVTGLISTEIPLVYAYCYTQNSQDYMIDSDNQRIATEVVAAMLQKGHHRVGLISGPVDSAADRVSDRAHECGDPHGSCAHHLRELERIFRGSGLQGADAAFRAAHRDLLYERLDGDRRNGGLKGTAVHSRNGCGSGRF